MAQPGNWRHCRDIVLDERSTTVQTQAALEQMAAIFTEIGGVQAERSFDGWREDTWLAEGVAINPAAAAFCIMDFQRSTCFLRGVHAAMQQLSERFSQETIRVLYAGCGPFALQLLPLLELFDPQRVEVHLLDIHQASLDSVGQLLGELAPLHGRVVRVKTDASQYQLASPAHLIIAETMQKSLEQEPQFAVTANLAPQLAQGGIFIPERIEVELCLANLQGEQSLLDRGERIYAHSLVASGQRMPLGNVFCLEAATAATQLASAQRHPESALQEIELGLVSIPDIGPEQALEAALFTRIQVYNRFRLLDYDCQITLPSRPQGLARLRPGNKFRASYQLGAYPRLEFRAVPPMG